MHIQYTIYNIQCTIYNIQYTIYIYIYTYIYMLMYLSFIDFPQTDGGIVAQLHSWGRQPWGSNDRDAIDRDPGKAQWKLIRIPSKCAPVEVSTCHPQIQRCDSVLSLENPILQQLWTSCAVIITIMMLMLMIIAIVVIIVIYLKRELVIDWFAYFLYSIVFYRVFCTFQLSHCLLWCFCCGMRIVELRCPVLVQSRFLLIKSS